VIDEKNVLQGLYLQHGETGILWKRTDMLALNSRIACDDLHFGSIVFFRMWNPVIFIYIRQLFSYEKQTWIHPGFIISNNYDSRFTKTPMHSEPKVSRAFSASHLSVIIHMEMLSAAF